MSAVRGDRLEINHLPKPFRLDPWPAGSIQFTARVCIISAYEIPYK